MARKKKSRLKTRGSGPEKRYYGDFRDFEAVGGGYEALIPPGATRGTTDPDLAVRILAERLQALEDLREARQKGGVASPRLLEGAVADYLEDRARPDMSKSEILTLTNIEGRLRNAIEFFGARTLLSDITTARAKAWMNELERTTSKRTGGPLADGTIRKYLDAFSGLWGWAAQYGTVKGEGNPIRSLQDKPTSTTEESVFLEVPEGALVLEAARLHTHERPDQASVPAYEVVACFLLTGGRKSEVLELTPARFDFVNKRVTLRNSKRTRRSRRPGFRTVPLWPQLEGIMGPYIERRELGRDDLLFPSRNDPARPITEPRKTLGTVLEDAGLPDDHPPTKIFRHTYCTARVQTVEPGPEEELVAITPSTVAKELGQGGRPSCSEFTIIRRGIATGAARWSFGRSSGRSTRSSRSGSSGSTPSTLGGKRRSGLPDLLFPCGDIRSRGIRDPLGRPGASALAG
jgi:integrase